MECKFIEAWIGVCGIDCKDDFCDEHKKLKCCSCGAQATKTCHETNQFVCGFPLCDDCEHTICDNGCNSGGNLPEGLRGHCKKSEQIYKPWIMQDEIEDESKKDLQIIYKHGKPEGIRNSGGYLFFFTGISKYDNQEERYRKEIEEQYELADFLLEALKNK